MNVREIVGANVRRLRLSSKRSQERLAHDAGIDASFLGEIERASRSATVTTLDALAGALGVEVVELFRANTAAEAKGLPRGRRGASRG